MPAPARDRCLPPPPVDDAREPMTSGTFSVGKNPRISWIDFTDLGLVVAIPRPPRVPVFPEIAGGEEE
jgi:hypothetical protein